MFTPKGLSMNRDEDSSAAVFRVIREQGPINRSEIARRTGLSPSGITVITKRLLDAGIVTEVEGAEEKRSDRLGRPPILLRLRPDHAYMMGAKLDHGELNTVLTDLEGTVVARRNRHLDTSAPEDVVAATASLLRSLARGAGIEAGQVAGLGLGMAGLVDGSEGVCVRSVILDWADVPIRALLKRELGLPVAVENDANTLAIAEGMYGGARGVSDFAVVSIGRGIGCGLVVGGRLYRGRFGAAGEIGHCTVRIDGPRCACGKSGCLDAVASVPATLQRASEAGLVVSGLSELGDLARAGDPRAAELLDDVGDAIGLALSHLVNLVNPELLILTGSGVALRAPLRNAIEAGLARHVFPTLPRLPKLVIKREQRDMWARGAASLAAQSYFDGGRWETLADA